MSAQQSRQTEPKQAPTKGGVWSRNYQDYDQRIKAVGLAVKLRLAGGGTPNWTLS